ncbi:MAG: tetratricopeptide repeat protein, partial [Chloroflexi bacterium]|nr:tetratricopeptide repeat protein [Chloroflexota bacterium]
ATLRQIITLAPDNPEAHYQLADALATLARYDEALTAIDAALRLLPDNTDVLVLKASIQYDADDVSQALETIEHALEIEPQNVDALRSKAEMLRLQGRAKEALRLFERALRVAPDDNATLSLKGYALIDLEQYAEALETLQRAFDGNPEDASLLAAMAYTHAQLEQYTLAWTAVCRAKQLQPHDPIVLTTYASIASSIGDYTAALEALDQIAEPGVDTWLHRGWAYENLQQSDQARMAYEQALKLATYPDTLWAHKGLGNALRLAHDPAAISEYEAAIKEAADHAGTVTAELFSALGWCQYQLSHYDEAIRLYNEALSLQPGYFSVQFDLALALLCSRRIDQAVAEYQRTRHRVMAGDRLRARGLLYVARDDIEEALYEQADLTDDPRVQQIRTLLHEAYAAAKKEH